LFGEATDSALRWGLLSIFLDLAGI